MDTKGKHALNCRSGKGPTYRHDKVNEIIPNLIEERTMNYYLEPRRLDGNNEQRPDIIIHDEFKQKDSKYTTFYIDTMITDIYKKINVTQINNGDFGIFNAGKNAEKYKLDLHLDRFNDLKEKGYRFIPTIMESTGGINKGLRFVINTMLRGLAAKKNKDFSIMVHN